MRVYTDGARDDDIAAMGWRIECDGDVEENHRYMLGEYTSMEAEYYALVDGLRHALRRGNEIMVFTDCEPLVEKMRYSTAGDGEWYERKCGVDRLLDKFEWWQIEWIPRTQNEAANTQASLALRKGRRHS